MSGNSCDDIERLSSHESGHAWFTLDRNQVPTLLTRERGAAAEYGDGAEYCGLCEADYWTTEQDSIDFLLAGIAGEEVGRARFGYPFNENNHEWAIILLLYHNDKMNERAMKGLGSDIELTDDLRAKYREELAPRFEELRQSIENSRGYDGIVQALIAAPTMGPDEISKAWLDATGEDIQLADWMREKLDREKHEGKSV